MSKKIISILYFVIIGTGLFANTQHIVDIVYKDSIVRVNTEEAVSDYITTNIEGAHVAIKQSELMPFEIVYHLSGHTDDGSFLLKGNQKSTIELDDLKLANPNGAALYIQNKRATDILVKEKSENSLSGGSVEEKCCFFIKGSATFKGQGILTLSTTTAGGKGLKSNDRINFDEGTLIIHASGAIDTTDVNDPSYVAGIKAEGFTLNGGKIEININGTAGRGITANDIETNGGELTINNTAIPTIFADDVKSARGLKGENIALNAGVVTIEMTGDAGKGITVGSGTKTKSKREFPAMMSPIAAARVFPQVPNHSDFNGPMPQMGEPNKERETGQLGGKPQRGGPMGGGNPEEVTTYTDITGLFTIGNDDGSGPTLKITTTGKEYNSSSAKAIKAICSIAIYGGKTEVYTEGDGAEGMESKDSIDIKGGKHLFVCYDDCINSAGSIIFNGGTTVCISSHNDGVDSNAGKEGAITIGDGNVFAFTAQGAPEEGLDCDNNRFIRITGKGKAISGQIMQQEQLSLDTISHLLDILTGL